MNGTVKIALAVIVTLFIFGGIAVVGLNSQANSNNGSTDAPGLNSSPAPSATEDKDVAATITYTGKGFEPDLDVVQVGDTVRVRNRSIRLLRFVSDPYGKETNEPELNIGELKPGENKTFYVSQKGIWGYHNALDPSEHGRLIVQ